MITLYFSNLLQSQFQMLKSVQLLESLGASSIQTQNIHFFVISQKTRRNSLRCCYSQLVLFKHCEQIVYSQRKCKSENFISLRSYFDSHSKSNFCDLASAKYSKQYQSQNCVLAQTSTTFSPMIILVCEANSE